MLVTAIGRIFCQAVCLKFMLFSLRNSADKIAVFLFKRLGIFAVKKKKNISIYISDNEADNFMHPENKPSYVVAVVL